MRAVPPAALALLKQFEGKDGTFEAVPTQDPVGNWEIGWGHKLSGPGPEPAFPGSPLDEAAADAFLRRTHDADFLGRAQASEHAA